MREGEEKASSRAYLFPYAIYTTLARSRFDDALAAGRMEFREGKRWTSAVQLFEEAHAQGQNLALLISDGAQDCSRLVGWAHIERIDLDPTGTTVVARSLKPLRGRQTQELLLRGSGAPIAKDFIRPYALIHTPAFISTGRPPWLETNDTRQPPTLFSFGYEGCGPGTARLVAAVEQVEAARGFEPPLWVDARISRSVRAVGFRDKAFEMLLGPDRYRWMPDLGNDRVKEGRDGVQIHRPEAVADLLGLALDRPLRRVIFFCSCAGSLASCHRHEVGRLLIRHARRTGVRVRRVEWPGGIQRTMVIDVPSTAALARETLDTEGVIGEAEAASVAWGSYGILRAEKRGAEHVLLGPALFGEKRTSLRVATHLGPRPPSSPTAAGRRWRREHGTEEDLSG